MSAPGGEAARASVSPPGVGSTPSGSAWRGHGWLEGARVLVTGAAGFIGSAACRRLLALGAEVVGVDSMDAGLYPADLKADRLRGLLEAAPGAPGSFRFERMDVSSPGAVEALLASLGWPDGGWVCLHAAAQAGVRRSIEHPRPYWSSNCAGWGEVLEAARKRGCAHLVWASSSSVYGDRREPGAFSEADGPTTAPRSLYAATKVAGEAAAAAYAHLHRLPITGLRFFTVYGPWGRPDMAVWGFTRSIELGEPVRVFDGGRVARDWTHVDDVVEGVLRVLGCPPRGEGTDAPCRVLNIGRGEPTPVGEMLDLLEGHLGRRAVREMVGPQPGDVRVTWADTTALRELTGYAPRVSLDEGLRGWVDWWRSEGPGAERS